jgi:hypothetical protein
MKFKSPCEVFTNETIHQSFLDEAMTIRRCKKMYEEYFIQELEQMCPTGHFTQLGSRQKRFVISLTILSVIVMAIVAAVGLGLSSTADGGGTEAEQPINGDSSAADLYSISRVPAYSRAA